MILKVVSTNSFGNLSSSEIILRGKMYYTKKINLVKYLKMYVGKIKKDKKTN